MAADPQHLSILEQALAESPENVTLRLHVATGWYLTVTGCVLMALPRLEPAPVQGTGSAAPIVLTLLGAAMAVGGLLALLRLSPKGR